MTGHGFEVTGDPADLPPGAKIIEINLNADVEVAARALHERMATGSLIMPQDWDGMAAEDKAPFMELAYAAIMALVETGWHPPAAYDAIKAAMGEDTDPNTGMDPR